LTLRIACRTIPGVLRFLTAGESHGKTLNVIVDGLPAGVAVSREAIDADLRRRQGGYGRGGRMKIERDEVQILSGVRHGRTLGSPVSLMLPNLDHESWRDVMSPEPQPEAARERRRLRHPRPGHADLAGALKYGTTDLRNVVERASARETAARVAAGALARSLLLACGALIRSHVLRIGEAAIPDAEPVPWERLAAVEESPVRSSDPDAGRAMMAEIDRAKKDGDSIGGIVEVVARGVPAGLGSFAEWDRRLDGRIAQALASIPAVKAVSLGEGWLGSRARGSAFHDEILWSAGAGIERPTNRAGGLEGGVTNGEEIRAAAVVKPIPTLVVPLRSIDLRTGAAQKASVERSDTCVVPAAGVVAEAMLALVLADALLEKTGGDSLDEVLAHLRASLEGQGAVLPPR
jgi:chorismate synthase